MPRVLQYVFSVTNIVYNPQAGVEHSLCILAVKDFVTPGIAFLAAAAVFVPTVQAQAQQTQSPPVSRVIVIGEGSVSVTPDYAQIGSGVTTRAKTVKEATEANSKLMAAIINALLESGVAQRDVQTSRFSIQPIYAPQEPRDEPKLAGYSVSNQVRLKIRQIHKVGEILDLGVKAGLVEKSGSWFSYDSVRIGQGRENAKQYLKENPDMAKRIENAIRGRTEEVSEALMVGVEPDDGELAE